MERVNAEETVCADTERGLLVLHKPELRDCDDLDIGDDHTQRRDQGQSLRCITIETQDDHLWPTHRCERQGIIGAEYSTNHRHGTCAWLIKKATDHLHKGRMVGDHEY